MNDKLQNEHSFPLALLQNLMTVKTKFHSMRLPKKKALLEQH